MTSSLVGSEMCIRDSSSVALLGTIVVASTETLLTPSGWVWGFWVNIVPVSYTHLTLPTICSV
eukprot:12706454-Prorocentrum_lima.AAC.1